MLYQHDTPAWPIHNEECRQASEGLVSTVLRKMGIRYHRPDRGADYVLVDYGTILEVKDWSVNLTPLRLLTEVLERFQRTDPEHRKVWKLMFSGMISKAVRKLLRGMGIGLIWVPVQIDLDSSDCDRLEWSKAVGGLSMSLQSQRPPVDSTSTELNTPNVSMPKTCPRCHVPQGNSRLCHGCLSDTLREIKAYNDELKALREAIF